MCSWTNLLCPCGIAVNELISTYACYKNYTSSRVIHLVIFIFMKTICLLRVSAESSRVAGVPRLTFTARVYKQVSICICFLYHKEITSTKSVL